MIEVLTPKQKAVYELLITDMSFSDIKDELCMTSCGFNYHRRRLYEIFDCNSRTDLIVDHVETNFNYVELPFVARLNELQKAVYSLSIKGFTVDEVVDILKVSRSQSALARRRVLAAAKCRSVVDLIFKSYGVQHERV